MSKNGGGNGKGSKAAVPQKVRDQNGDMVNANRGMPGVNKHFAKVHGNRGKQIAQNQKAAKE